MYLKLTQYSSSQVTNRKRGLPRAIYTVSLGYLYWIFKNQIKQTLIRHTPCGCSSCLGDGGSRYITTGLNRTKFLKRHKPGTAGFSLIEAGTHHSPCQPPHSPEVQPSPAQSCHCTSVPCEGATDRANTGKLQTESQLLGTPYEFLKDTKKHNPKALKTSTETPLSHYSRYCQTTEHHF